MKTITVNSEDIQGSGFSTPPENQGQIVTTSYACTEDYILVQKTDASDGSEKIVAYEWPEDAVEGDFHPWNTSPRLGREIGIARII